jgi:hypothetical protein
MPAHCPPIRARLPARLSLTVLLLGGLAACGGGGSGGAAHDHMGLHCQTSRCLCVEDGLLAFGMADKREPEWRLSGEPFCPGGYHLETAGD